MKNQICEPDTIAAGFRFTESPHWRDGLMWFSDMHGDLVHAIDDAGTVRRTIAVPGGPGGLGWLPDGRLLIISTAQRLIYRLEGETLVIHADLSQIGVTEYPINDMSVGPDGSCYVGEFGLDIHRWLQENRVSIEQGDSAALRGSQAAGAGLFHVRPDGSVSEAAGDLRFPNGAVVTPDGRLIVAESLGLRLSIFDLAEDGAPTNRRTIDCDFLPDGVSHAGANGGVWVADPLGKAVQLLSGDGVWTHRIQVPRAPYACAFDSGRPDLLYLCTSPTSDPQESEALRDSRIEVINIQS